MMHRFSRLAAAFAARFAARFTATLAAALTVALTVALGGAASARAAAPAPPALSSSDTQAGVAANAVAADFEPVGYTRYRSFLRPDLCLDADRTDVYMHVCNNGAWQVWGFSSESGKTRLKNLETGLCLQHNGWQLTVGNCSSDEGVWDVWGVNGHVVFENAYRVSTRCPMRP